jgi:hypothetical protein
MGVNLAAFELQPVEFEVQRDHVFKKRPVKPRNVKSSPGCAICGQAQLALDHLGAPPSMNNHSLDRQAFNGIKHAWQYAIADGIERTGLPRGHKIGKEWSGIQAVSVQMLIGFDEYKDYDEGNLRWLIEKSFGDALVGGYWKRVKKTKVPVDSETGEPTVETRPVRGKDDEVYVCVVPGGWLPSDSFWPRRRYSMGALEGQHAPHESWVKFTIFPSLEPPLAALRMERR